jgi:hypothetical protein
MPEGVPLSMLPFTQKNKKNSYIQIFRFVIAAGCTLGALIPACGRLNVDVPNPASGSPSSMSTSTTISSNGHEIPSTQTRGGASAPLPTREVIVGFAIDTALNPAGSSTNSRNFSRAFALTSSAVVLQGINYAVLNIIGCTDARYNKETELKFNPNDNNALPAFTVGVGPSDSNCYLALDFLQLSFDNNGVASNELYLRDPTPMPSASVRDQTLIFSNRAPSPVGPPKISITVTVISWDATTPASGSSQVTYFLQNYKEVNVGTRSLSTIEVAPSQQTSNNAINVGTFVNMPVNLLTIESIIRPLSSPLSPGSYSFQLWCNLNLVAGACGDVNAPGTTTVFCAIPYQNFNATTLGSQCPASSSPLAGTISSATVGVIANFDSFQVSSNSNGILSATSGDLDDFITNAIPVNDASNGFIFVVRTDTATGTGFKYWSIVSIP